MSSAVTVSAAILGQAATASSNVGTLMPSVPENFWSDRWRLGQIGWHRTEVNNDLRRYWPLYVKHFNAAHSGATRRCRILVPLCGKSVDVLHLYKEGFEVVGVEYVEKAILDFFTEQAATFPKFERKKVSDSMEMFSSEDGRLQILRSDFFDPAIAPVLGTVDYVWDRAALIAIGHAAETRRKYVAQVLHILQQHSLSASALSSSSSSARLSDGVLLPHILLETFAYNQDLNVGPPFAQSDAQIRTLFGQVAEEGHGQGKEFPSAAGDKFKDLQAAVQEVQEISSKDAKKKVYIQLLTDHDFPDKSRFNGPAFVRIYSIQFA